MPTFAKQFLCFFFMVLCACGLTESRDIKFSKYVHPKKDVLLSSPTPAPQPITGHISYVPTLAPVGANSGSAPAPAPAPESLGVNSVPTPAPTPLGSDNDYALREDNWYYGLHTKGTGDSPQENAKYPTQFSTENPVLSNSDFPSEQENVFEEDREENGYLNNLGDENGFWNSNHNGYNSGRNYYDVDRKNYNSRGHELARENNYDEEYYNGNYGKSKYEFDSMEEYEKQEGYTDVQREFIP